MRMPDVYLAPPVCGAGRRDNYVILTRLIFLRLICKLSQIGRDRAECKFFDKIIHKFTFLNFDFFFKRAEDYFRSFYNFAL